MFNFFHRKDAEDAERVIFSFAGERLARENLPL
jgi:hypothetical protein